MICKFNGEVVPCPDWAPATFAGVFGLFAIFWVAFLALLIVSGWKIFKKAGQPGWKVLIPFYNLVILLRIAGRPGWWFILFCIPLVNIFVAVITCLDLAKAFGKSEGFAVGLILIGIVFFPLLAFGDARYVGPPSKQPAPTA